MLFHSMPPFDVTRTKTATALAAAVVHGGVDVGDPGDEPRISSPTELLSLLSSAMAPESSEGVHSFTEMVAASVGAGFVAGRGVRRAAQRAAASSDAALPTTREAPASSMGFSSSAMLGIPATGRLSSPSSCRVAPSG